MTKDAQPFIPFIYKLAAGFVIFAGMFVAACVFGAADVTVRDVWLALASNASGEKISIIREIRLPREIAAVFVGAALSISGAIMQGMTRNPLADPGLLGLTAGANAALALTLVLIPSANYIGILFACFIGAAVGAGLVFGIGAMKKGGFSPIRIVLAGAAVSAFLFAIAEGVGIYFKISKDVSMWTAGGIIGTSWSQLQVIVPVISIGILVSLFLSKQLTILSLNEEVAVGLGQNTSQIKTILFILVTLLAGASVALVGNMAFIGLMVPHIVRAIVGTDYRFILPMSALTGAAFMLLADTLGRTINAPYETPAAAIIAVMGLPFFLFIVHKGGKAFS
ncbi:iron complex transport system permease protein [Cytobacillus firmus]|uniref:Iron complex transport system permease protein n=2 Tax=Cytobacillus TaxID=2675230 RepID=A0A366JL69_CYTFI|nr:MULTISPECIES: iron ABC transporter permease [Cytobacillus]RBP88401.1 iron complex transport system permease protein [Cytobacillus firmus]TDX38475.1 iron complex transport system permease protein [Cytobacillus oceanisediminis]